jgi:NAD dependent epimerase/dehydratase family enzyme
LQHPELNGVINCTAPEAIQNTDLMHELRSAYGIPFGLPAPAWMLEAGAIIIGTETELILKSRWVTPKRLLDSGYRFLFPKAGEAIREILSTSI